MISWINYWFFCRNGGGKDKGIYIQDIDKVFPKITMKMPYTQCFYLK